MLGTYHTGLLGKLKSFPSPGLCNELLANTQQRLHQPPIVHYNKNAIVTYIKMTCIKEGCVIFNKYARNISTME
jgi:hypothetical protein